MKSFKSFIIKVSGFASLIFLIMVVGIFLPTTPRSSTSFLFAKLKMDSLLKVTESPRIILVGGSNISLSINSQMILDSLRLNPINTGLTVDLGFVYMFDNTLKYLRPGDIVVVSLEHEHFFDRGAYGKSGLVRTIVDVAPHEYFGLRHQQIFQMMSKLPYYALTKFKPQEYLFVRDPFEIYDRDSYNQYGDNCKHWKSKQARFVPPRHISSDPDQFAFDLLYQYKLEVEKKGATFLLTFPAFQASFFEIRKDIIKTIEKELRKRDYVFLGSSERYIMPDSLTFDTPYHFIKTGVDLRTSLLIDDLKAALHLD